MGCWRPWGLLGPYISTREDRTRGVEEGYEGAKQRPKELSGRYIGKTESVCNYVEVVSKEKKESGRNLAVGISKGKT